MNRGRHNLDDLLKVAHSEEPVVSTREIDGLLDAFDLHGRRSPDAQSILADLQPRTPKRRRILMGTLAFILLGTVLGTGALIWDDAPTTTMIPPTGDRAPIAAAEMTENDNVPQLTIGNAAPTPTAPPAVAFTPTSTSKPTTFTNVGDDTQKKLDGGDPEKEKTIIIDQEIDVEIDEDLSKLLEQVVGDYWETKINSYRQYVDRVVSSDDKQELDRLRVRWEMVEKGDGLFGQMAVNVGHLDNGNFETQLNGEARFGKPDGKTPSFHVDITQDMNDVTIDTTLEYQADVITFSENDKEQILNLLSKESDTNVVRVKQNVIVINNSGDSLSDEKIRTMKSQVFVVDVNTEDLEGSDLREKALGNMNADDRMNMIGSLAPMLKMMIKMDPSESSQIMVTTWGIAERNREELDGLKATIMNDLKEFGNVVAATMKEYAAANGDEMPDGFREQIAEKSGRIDEMLEDGPIAEVIGSLYETLAEPMILLYNGSDISPVLTSAIMQPVTGQTMAASSRLKQSFPNPATDEATIAFELDEPSAATTLRLFDATGSEVRRLDLGALPTGGNSTTLDVADLAAGTYLYHLTISTANGEQVFSKKMEIAR